MATKTKSKRKENNKQFFSRLLDISKSHPMYNMIIIEACRKYCEIVKDETNTPEKAAKFDESCQRAMVHGPAWRELCEDLSNQIEEHLKL